MKDCTFGKWSLVLQDGISIWLSKMRHRPFKWLQMPASSSIAVEILMVYIEKAILIAWWNVSLVSALPKFNAKSYHKNRNILWSEATMIKKHHWATNKVLQGKLYTLALPCKLWSLSNLQSIVWSCIDIHNMDVAENFHLLEERLFKAQKMWGSTTVWSVCRIDATCRERHSFREQLPHFLQCREIYSQLTNISIHDRLCSAR